MNSILRFIKIFIPRPVFRFFQPAYHLFLAYAAAAFYGFPSRKLKVIGVTGTNGKSTVVHMITSILEEAGEKVSSISSLRFRINGEEQKNDLKMTMPGRFRLQKFLRQAVNNDCRYAVLEVTSEGIKQFRHVGINFDIAVLTNVTPEHIESHGSFEKYRAAKAELFKKTPIHILNGEDPSIEYFLKIPSRRRIVYSKKDLPADFRLKLLGNFNIENAAAAYHAARELGIDREIIKRALEKIVGIPGRMEFVKHESFAVVVDYAHTPDALSKVYETLRNYKLPTTNYKLICIFGAAGGGRDKWKRPEMGKIAAEFCGEIILTNEDPYDENPAVILEDIEKGINLTPLPPLLRKERGKNTSFPFHLTKGEGARLAGGVRGYKKILDRREAIREALKSACPGDTVIITGKGAEPWIVGPNGTKMSWDDREVVKEELAKL